MKRIYKILFCLLIATAAQAQQDAMFTHYMFNTLAVNPAYAGSRDALTITGLHRSMWVGFDGAPTTQTVTLHSPIFNDKMGIGFSMVNDKIGPANSTDLSLDLSYALQLNEKYKLAFGLKSTMGINSVSLTSLELDDASDPAFAEDLANQLTGNVGAGLYLHSDNFYTGLSVPGLIQGNLYNSDVLTPGKYQHHFFYIIGGVIKLSESVKFKPTSLVKVTPQSPIEGDLTASFLFNDKFWAGGMFRTGDALGILLGYYVTPQLAVGYSFDWSYANTTFEYNNGSHELMIRYDFIYHKQKQIISPRYF